MKTDIVKIRLTDEEKASWNKAARTSGKPLSRFVRDTVNAACAESPSVAIADVGNQPHPPSELPQDIVLTPNQAMRLRAQEYGLRGPVTD